MDLEIESNKIWERKWVYLVEIEVKWHREYQLESYRKKIFWNYLNENALKNDGKRITGNLD